MDVDDVVRGAAIVVGVYLAFVAALAVAGRGVLARELALLIPNLARLFKGLLGDPRVPKRAKVALALGSLYLASPLDLIPDFIPGVGALDDAIVMGLVLRFVLRSTDRVTVAGHWRGDPATLARILRLAGA